MASKTVGFEYSLDFLVLFGQAKRTVATNAGFQRGELERQEQAAQNGARHIFLSNQLYVLLNDMAGCCTWALGQKDTSAALLLVWVEDLARWKIIY